MWFIYTDENLHVVMGKMNMQKWKLVFLHIYVFWQNRFDRLYRISSRERPQKFRLAYTYGQVSIDVVKKICDVLSFHKETRFLELGSGIGIFSLYASLTTECTAKGIEIIPTFVQASQRCADFLNLSCSFEKSDLWDVDWSEHDIIYLTTTTFPKDWLLRLESKVDEISSGSFLIVLTNQIQNTRFTCVQSFVEEFSWGVATVFIYQCQEDNSHQNL